VTNPDMAAVRAKAEIRSLAGEDAMTISCNEKFSEDTDDSPHRF
jgi:hypothetical protein